MKPVWKVVILSVIVLGGIGGYVYSQYKKAMNYAYKIKSFTIEKISLTDTIFSFVVKVKNKSSIKAVITGYKFELFLNNIKVANVFSDKVQPIDNNGISELNMSFQFNPKEVLSVQEALKFVGLTSLNKDKVNFKLVGTLSGKVANAIDINEQKLEINYTLAELLAPKPTTETEVWD